MFVTRSIRLLLLKYFLLVLLCGMTTSPSWGVEPVKIIFDTDVTGDIDDVLALAMLHTLADRQECELLAVTISKINPLTGPFIDAVNTFYGRPDIPIGVTQNAQKRESKFLRLVLQKDANQFRYPHDVISNAKLPDAVSLLRKTLAKSKDHSIIIIQVGLAANLADLLDSKPDKFSSLSGLELVRKKVKLISVMAGNFEPINGNKHFLEANVRDGIDSMQRFTKNCPEEVRVIWSGFEIGIAVRYPRQSIARDFCYRKHHIVPEAYLLHSGANHDRPCWDLTSVLYAVRPNHGYFNLSPTGLVNVKNDGYLSIKTGLSKRDRFLIMNSKQTTSVIQALQLLVSQPPGKK